MRVVSDGIHVPSVLVQQPDSPDELHSGQSRNKLGQGPDQPPGGPVRKKRVPTHWAIGIAQTMGSPMVNKPGVGPTVRCVVQLLLHAENRRVSVRGHTPGLQAVGACPSEHEEPEPQTDGQRQMFIEKLWSCPPEPRGGTCGTSGGGFGDRDAASPRLQFLLFQSQLPLPRSLRMSGALD